MDRWQSGGRLQLPPLGAMVFFVKKCAFVNIARDFGRPSTFRFIRSIWTSPSLVTNAINAEELCFWPLHGAKVIDEHRATSKGSPREGSPSASVRLGICFWNRVSQPKFILVSSPFSDDNVPINCGCANNETSEMPERLRSCGITIHSRAYLGAEFRITALIALVEQIWHDSSAIEDLIFESSEALHLSFCGLLVLLILNLALTTLLCLSRRSPLQVTWLGYNVSFVSFDDIASCGQSTFRILQHSISKRWWVTFSNPLFGTPLTHNSSSIANINATVKDNSGRDVTAHFKTMLYRAPHRRRMSQLNDRQTAYVRRIDGCGEMEGIFVDSHCNHKNKVLGSLQAYTYRCLVYLPNPRYPRYAHRTIVNYAGDCHDDELCVSGVGQNQLRGNTTVEMAHCVKSEAYTRLESGKGVMTFDESLKGARLEVALSEQDQKTPLEADSMHAQSGTSALAGAKGSTQSKSCIDCLDLDTGPLSANTDFLETEVRLMTAGVAAGILWLTIWSG